MEPALISHGGRSMRFTAAILIQATITASQTAHVVINAESYEEASKQVHEMLDAWQRFKNNDGPIVQSDLNLVNELDKRCYNIGMLSQFYRDQENWDDVSIDTDLVCVSEE
jgi:arginine decarboxylase-like protein